MGEGYWIRSDTRAFFKIDEHARWIGDPANAGLTGLDAKTLATIRAIPWDIDGPGRKAIVRAATAAGLIRFRDHDDYMTFEFQMPLQDALRAIQPFVDSYLGFASSCRLNDLASGQCWLASGNELLAGTFQPNPT